MMLGQLDVLGKKKRKKSMLNLTSYTKSNLEWIVDLNTKSRAMKFPEEYMGEKPLDLRLRQKVLRFDTKNATHKQKNIFF